MKFEQTSWRYCRGPKRRSRCVDDHVKQVWEGSDHVWDPDEDVRVLGDRMWALPVHAWVLADHVWALGDGAIGP